MDNAAIAQLRADPDFVALQREKRLLSWSLAVLMMAIYGVFLVLVAFDKAALGQKLGAGPITVAFPLGLAVIVSAVVLTGVYVVRANTRFDPLTARIVARAGVGAGGVGYAPELGA